MNTAMSSSGIWMADNMAWRNIPGNALLCAAAILPATILWACAGGRQPDCFVVRVIDQNTGRGVPLVELKLPNEVTYWTDSAAVYRGKIFWIWSDAIGPATGNT
jgi:hypothetical protein